MNTRALRTLLVRELPKDAFRPVPSDGLLLLPMICFIVTASWAAAKLPMGMWPFKLLAGVSAGIIYGSLFFLGHETLHGGIFRSKKAQFVLGYLAFLVFFLSPSQWRSWHNVWHHGKTNMHGQDPDCYDLDNEQRNTLIAKIYYWLSPGSGSIGSYFYLFHFFSLHCQLVLWLQSKYRILGVVGSQRNRRRAIVESLSMMAFWLIIAISLGCNSFFVVLVPMLVANYTVMSFVATNHFLRPMVDENDPLANSMSVRCWYPYDLLNLYFSHHVEHHLFPSMNWRYRRMVRGLLEQYVPGRYVCPRHFDAIKWLYRTPRRYQDYNTLVCPYTGRSFDLDVVAQNLNSALARPRGD